MIEKQRYQDIMGAQSFEKNHAFCPKTKNKVQ